MPSAVAKEEMKRCSACREEKAIGAFSKKQWMGKAKRRCQECQDAGKVFESRAPPPIARALCWDLYYMLQGGTKADAEAGTKKKAYLRAAQGLTEEEIQQTRFADVEEACMAVLRGMALLDTEGGNDCRSASFLLIARAMLWLARDAHRCCPLPVGDYGKAFDDRESLQRSLQAFLLTIKTLPAAKPLALTYYAFMCARQVACAEGHSARPGWPEAWMTRAECELLLCELRCRSGSRGAAAKRPPNRLGPWAATAEDALAWEVDVPGHHAQDARDAKTHLGDHWWSLDGGGAKHLLTTYLLPAVRSLELLQGVEAADPQYSKDKARRRAIAERALFRRGAACVAALAAADDGSDEKLGSLVDDFRRVFPGSPFDPTPHFLKRLPSESHASSAWRVDVAGGELTVADVGAESPHASRGYLLAKPVTPAECGDAEAVYDAVVRAMAGADYELRATGGPPRKPKVVELSPPLDAHVGALAEKLAVLGVKTTAAAAAAKGGARKAPAAIAVGRGVVVRGLESKPEHNGRKGEVVRWLPEKSRWEVSLTALNGQKALLLSLKPNNLELA